MNFKFSICDGPISWRQIWKPRTKKRRIQNKWNDRNKRPGNFKPVFLKQPLIDRARNTIVCTSKQRDQIRLTSGV